MASGDRFPGPHPLCTCPELIWDVVTGRAPAPDYQACRDRAPLGIDPHPVAELSDLMALGAVGLIPWGNRG